MKPTVVSLFAGVGGALHDLDALRGLGPRSGQRPARELPLLGEAMAVGADDHSVRQGVLAPLGLRREVVGVAPSRVPAADHAHVTVEAPQGLRPSVPRLVNADGRDHVGPALVPGPVNAVPLRRRLAELASMLTQAAVVPMNVPPLSPLGVETTTELPATATAFDQRFLHV